MRIECEQRGWTFAHSSLQSIDARVIWSTDPDRAHLIVNLGGVLSRFEARLGGLPYDGVPSTGEYGWVPCGEDYGGVFGPGETSFLTISPPAGTCGPAVPVLGAFSGDVLRMAWCLEAKLIQGALVDAVDIATQLWQRLLEGQTLPHVRRGARVGNADFVCILSQLAMDPRTYRSAEHIAHLQGVSVDGLNRTFAERFGITAARYLEEARLRTARRLLLQSNEPLRKVAFDAGFASQSHMTDRMRLRVGTTPARLRASLFTPVVAAAENTGAGAI